MIQNFETVATQWKISKRPYVKNSTYSVYIQLCNKHLIPRFGAGQQPDQQQVQSFVDQMLEQGYALKTVKDTLLVLRMILRFGERSGNWTHLELNIHFPTQSEIPRQLVTLSQASQKQLLSHLRAHFSFPNLGILICLQSGLRIGEVCGLQWKDLDPEAGVIRVNKTVQRIYLADGAEHAYFLSIDTPKTLSSIREIPLSSELKTLLKPLRKVMQPDYYVVSNAPRPLEPRHLRDYFYRLQKKLNLPPVRFHALRHSFATRCIESKCDYKTVSVILGHASISTTLDLYVHPGFDQKKRCIDRLTRSMK